MADSDSENDGCSLLVAYQLKTKHVLLIGGGEVASQRITSLLPTRPASLTILAPLERLHPRTLHLINENPTTITHVDALYSSPSDIPSRTDMILTAIDNPELSLHISQYARSHKIPFNAADIPDLCDFYFGSQIRDGPLQIMVSTNGNGPRLANMVKERVRNALSGTEGEAIRKAGMLRRELRSRAPGVGGTLGRKRMRWVTEVCDEWGIEGLARMDREVMEKLLDEGWEMGKVPKPEDMGVIRAKESNRKKFETFLRAGLPSTTGFASGIVLTLLVMFARRRWTR